MDDERATFEVWVKASQHRLVRSAFLLTGDLQHAEDLVQDALVKVAVRWSRLSDENVDAYVRRVMYHDHISWWRRKRWPIATSQPDTQAVRDHSDAVHDQQVVAQALARLTAKQRAVVVLRYFEDLTEQQTADVLGVRVGTVKSQTSVALSRLRNLGPEYSLTPVERGDT